jgi:hypothetical protein
MAAMTDARVIIDSEAAFSQSISSMINNVLRPKLFALPIIACNRN